MSNTSFKRLKFIYELVQNSSIEEVTESQGLSRATVIDYIAKFEKKVNKESNNKASFEQNKNTANGTIVTAIKPRTLEDAAKLFEVDLNIWEATRMKINSWDVTNKKGDTFANHQVAVWFSKKKDSFNKEEFVDYLNKKFDNHKPIYKPINYTENKSDNLLEICVYDLHIDKLCWECETGEDNYDVKIAKERMREVILDHLKKASGFDFERIMFVVGNDYFHTDNIHNTTTAGTPQDVDLRWQKSYKIAVDLLIETIDLLRTYAPVDVIVIPGNHDFTKCYYAGNTLELWYSNCKDVTVDNSPKTRKYYKYGQNLIGITHGNEEKESDLPLLMAQEEPVLWGETKYREFHVAHLHHKKEIKYLSTKDYVGVIVRYMKTLSPNDSWHARKGYKSIKGSEAFLWNKTKGITAMFETNM